MTTTGWVLFIAALGMMAGLVGADIAKLNDWSQIFLPSFVGNELIHFAAVVTAFIGGKLIPPERDPQLRTREDDKFKVTLQAPVETKATVTPPENKP